MTEGLWGRCSYQVFSTCNSERRNPHDIRTNRSFFDRFSDFITSLFNILYLLVTSVATWKLRSKDVWTSFTVSFLIFVFEGTVSVHLAVFCVFVTLTRFVFNSDYWINIRFCSDVTDSLIKDHITWNYDFVASWIIQSIIFRIALITNEDALLRFHVTISYEIP